MDVCEKRYLFNRVAEDDKSFSSRDACPPVTMPGKLLTAWQKHLEKEKADFKKALTRYKLLGTFKDTALAGVDVENISLMAKGSETLPPATPEKQPEPKPVETGEAAPTIAAVDDSGVVSGAQNEAALAAASSGAQPPATSVAVAAPETRPSVEPVVTAPENDAPDQPDNVVRAIPVPERAPRGGEQVVENAPATAVPVAAPTQAASQPAKKKPWWIRKIKEDEPPVSLIQPSQ